MAESREARNWSQIYVDTLRIRCFKGYRVSSIRLTDLEECTMLNRSYCANSTLEKINGQDNRSV